MSDDHSLQTVVITKPTAVSNRFFALLCLSQSLPKLPPHFAKCGGNQQNESLPYFLLFHFHAEEEAGRCAEEVSLRREDSAMTNPNISAEAKPSLRSR